MVEPSGGLGQVFLEQLIENTVLGLEIIVTIIIIIIVGITLAHLFLIALSTFRKRDEKEKRREYASQLIRRMLRGLLISIDILVAADLLKSILVPTVTELATLAIIVVIRVILSWSLSKEIDSHISQKRL
jgi:uncharacterized membrane protein